MKSTLVHRSRAAAVWLFGALKVLMVVVTVASQPSGSQAAEPDSVSEVSDPPLALAKYAKQTIEAKELAPASTEEEIFKAIDTAITGLRLDTLTNSQAALEGFAAAAQRLNQLAEQLLEHHKRYDRDLDALQSALVGAPAIFREAGKAFRRYAEEEPYAELKQDYITVAETWEQIANTVEQRAHNFKTQETEIIEAVKYVERTSVYLRRLQQHLEALPDVASLGERERYLGQLKDYARTFEEMRALFRRFHDEMMKQAVSPSLRRPFMLAELKKAQEEEARKQEEEARRREEVARKLEQEALERSMATVTMATGNAGFIPASRYYGFLDEERFVFYRNGRAVGTLEIVDWRGTGHLVRRISGESLLNGDTIHVHSGDTSRALSYRGAY